MTGAPTGWNSTARNGLLIFAAVFLALAGLFVVRSRQEDDDACRQAATQSWEDIYTLQEEVGDYRVLPEPGCDRRIPTSTLPEDEIDELEPGISS